VVDVVFVGHEWVFAATDAVRKYTDDVETWHHEWRKGYDEGMKIAYDAMDRYGGELDAQETEHDANGERAGVAHEDFFLFLGIAEDVVVEKWHDDAERDEGDEGVGVAMEGEEDDAIVETGYGAEA